MSSFLDRLLSLHGIVAYLAVGALVLAEDAIFVGFVIPGETAAILGGVAASRHHVSITALCAVVVVAAVVGDSIGYAVGARYGTRLLRARPLRRRAHRLDRARDLLSRRGGPAVFAGRFVAFFRAVMPALAGSAHMPYGRFLTYNVAGGLVWGVGSVLIGYLAGGSYRAIEQTFGQVTAVILAVLVIAGLVIWQVRRHRREERQEEQGERPAAPLG